MSHPPGCRLAHSKDPGVPYRGQAPGEGRLAGGWHSLHLQCLKLEKLGIWGLLSWKIGNSETLPV